MEIIEEAVTAKHLYEFGPFLLDPQERLLLRDGQPRKMTDKVFELLCVLVQERGHLLSKDELMAKMWPDDKFVEEGNLTRNVSTLRMTLGETSGSHEYIETVPKRGYRFVASVRDIADNGADQLVQEQASSHLGIDEKETSDLDRAAQALDQDSDLAISQFKMMNAEATSLAPKPASVNQSALGATDVLPFLTRSRRSGLRAALLVFAALILVGIAYTFYFHKAPAARQPEIKSLAVLPLKSLNKERDDDYLGLGLADTIITRVCQINDLTVRPTSAVRKYANQEVDTLEAARQLNVDSVLDGTVQRAGDRLHINLNLLRAHDGASLWSDGFNASITDVFRMQDEISQQVAARLRLKLRPQGQAHLNRTARSVNPEAYDYYLRAMFHAGLQNETDSEAATALLERAVQIDPNFAAAYAELAHEYRDRAFALKPQEKELEERAFADAEKALSLDPDLAEGHIALGLLLWTHSNHFPHERAVQEYRRALELNPNSDEAHHELASVYNHIGLLDKAAEEIQKAVAINPSNTAARFRIGVNLLYQCQYEQALNAFGDSSKFNPGTWAYQTAWALFQLGRKEEAAARIKQFLTDYPQDEGGILTSMEALIAAAAYDERGAEQKIERAAEIGKGFGHFHHAAYAIASAYALMNKHEQAIGWLQRTADDGFPCYPLFERDPNLNNLRKDPRFITFMAKLRNQWEHYQATL